MAEIPSTHDVAYLAGFIDGEGTIRLERRRRRTGTGRARRPAADPYGAFEGVVCIYNTNLAVLAWIAEHWPPTNREVRQRPNLRHKPYGTLRYCGRRAYRLLEAVGPYLKVKSRQAELVASYEKLIGRHGTRIINAPAREALAAEIRDLNRRGP